MTLRETILGGLGYALFIFASKLLKIESGLAHLVWLFGFGSLYLAIPYAMEGFSMPSPPVAISILGLVIFPTIGGFYFTTKATQHGNASSVQIIESSDPLFAIVLFGESLGVAGWLGALCIMTGLLLALKRGKEPLPERALYP